MGVLRFLLAFFVVWAHVPSSLKLFPGDMSVQVFYAISGFYISLILKNNPAYLDKVVFWKQRLYRIFPAYMVMLMLTCLYYVISYSLGYHEDFFNALKTASSQLWVMLVWLLSQFFILGQDIFFFLQLNAHGDLSFSASLRIAENPANRLMLMPQSWTLALELMFYLLAPFILKQSALTVMWLCLLSVLLKVALQLFFALSGDPWSYRFFPSELCFFLLGALGAGLTGKNSVESQNIGWLRYSFVATLVVAGAVVNRSDFAGSYLVNPGFYVMWATLIVLPGLFILTKENVFDRAIGELSYPLYISHFLPIMIFGRLFGENLAEIKMAVVCSAVALAILLYFFVDRPMSKYRHSIIPSLK